jgi:hypothetical protein
VANVFCSWYFPFKQSIQANALVLNFFPAAQVLQEVATLFSSWYFPSVQPMQEVVLKSQASLALQVEEDFAWWVSEKKRMHFNNSNSNCIEDIFF